MAGWQSRRRDGGTRFLRNRVDFDVLAFATGHENERQRQSSPGAFRMHAALLPFFSRAEQVVFVADCRALCYRFSVAA
jgi:hypothetical protein